MKINRNNTHKKEISNNISNKTGLPSSYTKKIIDDMISIIISNIVIQKIFKVKNFGTFSLIKKNKRIGRNPKSKIDHEISERNVITFKAAEHFKNKMRINARK